MWDVLGELGRAVREALKDWPGTLRLLCVLAAVTMAVVILQDAMGHASPRTTRRYDRSRGNLDRSPGYLLAGYIGRAR
jgi:hypothetical protein